MRTFTEWLVVPLLLLPVLAGAGVVLWAQDAHRRAQAPYREDGAARVAAWLRPEGPAAWMPEKVRGLHGPDAPGLVPFEHPSGGGRVATSCDAMGTRRWRFLADVPSPLSASELADPGVRLAVETGRPPASLDGAPPGVTALAGLLEAPDLDALREAPLPPETKRYVLVRWKRAGHVATWFDETETFLDVVLRIARASRALGAHRDGDLEWLVTDGGTLAVLPPVERLGFRHVLIEVGPPESAARLSWIFPAVESEADTLLWRGRVDGPLAGTFLFHARWQRWWQAPWVKRWAGPVLALLLAALLLPLALLVSIRRRRRLDEARVRFLNEMAHDLRTPLASLRLHADMLTEGRGKPEKQADYLLLLSREAARLSSLLANLLDLSRLEQRRRKFETGTLDVGAHAYRAAREFLLLHPERGEDLEVEGPEETWAHADATALARCLANLLENAGKFTPAGTPIRLTWSAGEDGVLLRVADEGPGIAEAERERVFERYARGRSARRDGVPGTGLGLSLVKELVEGMGGTVALEPVERGAAFVLRLPGARRG